jgi:hypothetical protein
MTLRELEQDQRGAIMLLGVFMAIFLTAMLYYVVGIGDAILQRERMQDASDAAAFSAAVVYARGMNVLVLINMVMAALLAVLIALRVVETLTTIALVAVSLMSFLNPELGTAIPELGALRTQMHEAAESWQRGMNPALEALHLAAVGVRDAVPAAAEIPVMTSVKNDYAPIVRVALVIPSQPTLPTRDGTYDELCKRASGYLGDFTKFVLEKTVPAFIAKIVSGAMEGLTSAGAGWFCGDGGPAPKTSVSQDAHYPALPSRKECIDQAPSQQGYSVDDHKTRCVQAVKDEHDSEPDPTTGGCVQRCGRTDPYEQRDALARQDCAPRKDHDGLRDFSWQARSFTRSYLFHAGVWHVQSDKETEEKSARYTLNKDDRRPCGGPLPSVSRDWNATPYANDSEDLQPVCSNATPPSGYGREGETASIEHIEVTRFFGCTETIQHEYDLSKYQKNRITSKDDDTGRKRVPQALQKGAKLGSEAFQLRAIVLGNLPRHVPEKILEVATWKSAEPTLSSTARELGQLSFAQAEYYFDVKDRNEDPGNFMWKMRWKARLRRFRLPETKGHAASSATEIFAQTCSDTLPKTSGTNESGTSPCDTDFSIADLFAH